MHCLSGQGLAKRQAGLRPLGGHFGADRIEMADKWTNGDTGFGPVCVVATATARNKHHLLEMCVVAVESFTIYLNVGHILHFSEN